MIKDTLFDVEIALRAAARGTFRHSPDRDKPIDIFLLMTDHYEPHVSQPTPELARERHEDWLTRYPAICARHRDADRVAPQHTFCYPWDEYDSWELTTLVEMCRGGVGEVELHLHHRDDTEATLRVKLRQALALYRSHGALSVWPDGRAAFGFVHGNWALDNSRIENGRNFCGVNNEITVLREEGCYADFTFPSWQHGSQPRTLNGIYYAHDDPERPKSHDRGRRARAGTTNNVDLLLLQGPLVPYFERRGALPRPAMDDADLAGYRRYSPRRLDRWIRAGIHVAGCPNKVFVKIHCHGAADKNRQAMLGEDLDALYSDAAARYNDGARYRMHYVTARQAYNVIRAIEDGVDADIMAARDYVLPPPERATAAATAGIISAA